MVVNAANRQKDWAHLSAIAADFDVERTDLSPQIAMLVLQGPDIAKRLEENNLICNYQACPDEESFTASGALRMGVSEMTRFGMEANDFAELADLIHDCIVNRVSVKDKVARFRGRFQAMRYCFSPDQYTDLIQQMHQLI